MFRTLTLTTCVLIASAMPTVAAAQDDAGSRTRIALGPQLVPQYPGADSVVVRPLIDIARGRTDQDFAFEAVDESFGVTLLRGEGFKVGPSLGFQGKRRSSDVGGVLPEVGFSFEIGGFAQYDLSDNFRVRGEVRQGVSGHDGLIANVSADVVLRSGDDTVFSAGPRVTLADDTYQNAYFGVAPADAFASGLPAYDAGGGVQSVGGTVGLIQQFTPHWGIYSYAKYDRLVSDAANSPVVAAFGSRNQYSGGVALTYTFDGGLF